MKKMMLICSALLLVAGVDPTVVSPGAIWWRDSRGYCLEGWQQHACRNLL